jgi:hypothetical protein
MANTEIPTDFLHALDGFRRAAGLLLGLAQVHRFDKAPFMKEAMDRGYANPVGSHTSECCQMWFMLRHLMPNFAALVDSARVYDILSNHDNGELVKGDVTLFDKVNGATDDKDKEIETVRIITHGLPVEVQNLAVQDITDFEANAENSVSLEVRIARLIDSLSGNVVVLEKGKQIEDVDTSRTADILRLRFIPRAHQLIQILQSQNQFSAANEIRGLALHHLQEYISHGVEIHLSEIE